MKKPAQHPIAEVPRRQSKVEITIAIDLGDVWSHYCTLNQDGEVVDRGRFRTMPKAIEKWFTDVPSARVLPDPHQLSKRLGVLLFAGDALQVAGSCTMPANSGSAPGMTLSASGLY
jgi:hypothetical protein